MDKFRILYKVLYDKTDTAHTKYKKLQQTRIKKNQRGFLAEMLR